MGRAGGVVRRFGFGILFGILAQTGCVGSRFAGTHGRCVPHRLVLPKPDSKRGMMRDQALEPMPFAPE